MRFLALVYLCLVAALSVPAGAAQVDCSEAYGGKEAKCEVIKCDAKLATFLGKWSGPFSAYIYELSSERRARFRPYQNEVTYSESDCLKNLANGETFIVGRRVDTYPPSLGLPAKIEKGLLITGKKSDGSPFFRTVDQGFNDFTLVYRNDAANISVWSLTVSAEGRIPELRFTAIDGQDFSETAAHKRNLTVTMSVGPADAPYWETVVASGWHSLAN